MSATIMDFRVREEMAGAVLKEVAALEPAERVREAESLKQIMVQAVRGLEDLWTELRDLLERGVSPSQAAVLGRILSQSANLIIISLELLVRESPSLEEFKKVNMASLQRIKECATSLHRLAEMPPPEPDPERLRSSLEQMERGEGIDAEDLLAELRR
jgi:hypothetical protein